MTHLAQICDNFGNMSGRRADSPSGGGVPWRDATGRTLSDYPRPSVAVDTAVLTVAPRSKPSPDRPPLQVQVLLAPASHEGADPRWALPGTFLHERERLGDAVARSLADKAGLTRRTPTTQLEVFDDPDRDHRGWVLSVAHLAAVPHEHVAPLLEARPGELRLAPASRPGPLPYDHAAIVKAAVTELRRVYRRGPDPLHLLGNRFTMTQLRHVHEAVAGTPLQKDTFRRLMEPHLRPTSALSSGRTGRPSQLYEQTKNRAPDSQRVRP